MSRTNYSSEFIDKIVGLQETGKNIYQLGQNLVHDMTDLEKTYVWLIVEANIHRGLGDKETGDNISKVLRAIESEILSENLPSNLSESSP